MSKIIGITVGTPMSPRTIKDKLQPVTSVNGVQPNEHGNVEIDVGSGGGGSVASSGSIIDVIELPTEDIREDVWYRLLTAKLFVYDNMIETWTCHCVNGLPEVGEVFTVDMSYFILYYNIQDGSVSAYADEALAAQFGLTAGWYPIEMVMQLGESTWGGIVTDINDLDHNDESLRLLLSYDYYTFKNEWTKLIFASEKAPKFNITWDGDMTGRPALDMSMLGFDQGLYFVKVSDDVFTTDELVGWIYTSRHYDGAVWSRRVDSDMIDTQTYPGAFTVNGYIIVVYDADVTASALGIPTGIYTNGVYFWLYTDSAEGGYVSNLTSPVRITKIDSKYLDVDVDSLGLALVATTGDYNHLINTPNLNSYTTESRVNTLISNAIGTAIGGRY